MASTPGTSKPLGDEELCSRYPVPANSPPPYYEAEAYPKVHSRRLRKVFSLPVGLALVLTCAISWLCFLLERETVHRTTAQRAAAPAHVTQFQKSLNQCAALYKFPARLDPATRKVNPRWNAATGQSETVVLRNATVFDGEKFLSTPVDIVFEKGLIVSVTETGSSRFQANKAKAKEYNLYGQWVTPGLVDMHSHHGVEFWPSSEAHADGNEVHPDFGPLTPFVRALDGLKADDIGTTHIASGGITTSLVIPGSANIMGGEGTVLKNRNRSGPNKEFVVEELLLEHGIPFEDRRRYMKMACGENPKRVYGHNRMGNAWVLRKHLAKAKELLEKQDAWCAAASRLRTRDAESQHRFLEQMGGGLPEELELDSTVGMLRGRVAMHNHCYEPDDFETMLRISKEFGFRVRAFHHAIAAWRVPEMLKEYGQNITIATFAEFSLYKWEGYDSSLYAGKILAEHGVPLAYKSDHGEESTNAKYLLNQAATAHSFHVPADIALQSVTSVPAKAIDMDDRVGYLRPGYDADIVVWDANPLSIGATPRQVFIDGVATIDPIKVEESIDAPAAKSAAAGRLPADEPAMRIAVPEDTKREFCKQAAEKGRRFVISGIRRSFVEHHPELVMDAASERSATNLTLVVSNGKVECFGPAATCQGPVTEARSAGASVLNLHNGYLVPGITAVEHELGLTEISLDESTSNGAVSPRLDPKNRDNMDYSKYGIVLDGKGFVRARLGGVTRAVTPPVSAGGLIRGVSAGFFTSGKRKLVDGGIFRGDVAVHVNLGHDEVRVNPGSMSFAIKELRELLEVAAVAVQAGDTDASAFASVVRGNIPLVIHAKGEHEIQQVILLKRDFARQSGFASMKLVIYGGHEAYYVADELAEVGIPVILTGHRGAPDSWETRKTLSGPPLTRSAASILSEAGVLYAIAIRGEPPEGPSRIHDLALEASWAAKYAGLSDQDAIRLVSRNVEDILGLEHSGDIVVWDGSPLQFGGRPMLSFQAVEGNTLELAACMPDEDDME